MWYIAHTTAGRELDAVDKCRKAIPEDIAAKYSLLSSNMPRDMKVPSILTMTFYLQDTYL